MEFIDAHPACKKARDGVTANLTEGAEGGTHLHWPLGFHPSYSAELELKKFLLASENENGRAYDLPQQRRDLITAESTGRGFTIPAAMSLRRQYIRQQAAGRPSGGYFYNHNMSNSVDLQAMKDYAHKFEDLTFEFLTGHLTVPIVREAELQASGSMHTPDFYFPAGCFINGQKVNWIDCKTYYGSSSLAPDGRIPIGQIGQQVRRYCEAYGPGALLFLNGFSSDLMSQASLRSDQVLLLDASPLNIEEILHMPEVYRTELLCPKDKVSFLIGKNGHSIRDLMNLSDCTITAHQEEDRCIVVITSEISQEKVNYAGELVHGAISPCTRQVQRSIICPAAKMGAVIGPQGSNVKLIMQLTKCRIKTVQNEMEGETQIVDLTASSISALDHAERLIQQVVTEGAGVLKQYRQQQTTTQYQRNEKI